MSQKLSTTHRLKKWRLNTTILKKYVYRNYVVTYNHQGSNIRCLGLESKPSGIYCCHPSGILHEIYLFGLDPRSRLPDASVHTIITTRYK